MLSGLEWEELLARLASASPAPGGGSASALAGAAGAALAAMVARVAARRAAPGEAGGFDALAREAEGLLQRLCSLVEADARAFGAVMEARRLPRGTPAEEETRRAALARARARAVEVPLETAESCASTLELMARLVRRGAAPSAATDLGVGALLARAGAEGAILNVLVNLTPAEREAEGPGLAARRLSRRAAELAAEVSGWVGGVLGG
ncbi:MAG: cyclodeaminase/cyclohydrolase family protein [Acetobacteraceae bacterium]|nr:cyclodeaminase/cyclohydrolase family protein [Acetobacteraceae bacterium]